VLRLPAPHPRSLICFASGVHAILLELPGPCNVNNLPRQSLLNGANACLRHLRRVTIVAIAPTVRAPRSISIRAPRKLGGGEVNIMEHDAGTSLVYFVQT
jgi:hypothetical protein